MVSKWVKMWALVGYNAGEHTVVLWYMRFMHGHVAVANWLVYGILGGMGYRVVSRLVRAGTVGLWVTNWRKGGEA